MTRNLTNAAPASGDLQDGPVAVADGYRGQDFQGQSQRKGLRGLFALGFLIVSAAVSYGIVFVLIDKWYKGGTLGIL
jgi:hypothetical protein